MPIFKIPVNYVEVKDYEVKRESLEQALECLEDLLEVRVGIDHRITSINYKELLKRQLAESNKEKIEYLSYEDWFEEYAPIFNPCNLTSRKIPRTFHGRNSTGGLSLTFQDKAVYRFFSANYDFEQDAFCQDSENDITWSVRPDQCEVYFITTKIPQTIPNTLFVNL